MTDNNCTVFLTDTVTGRTGTYRYRWNDNDPETMNYLWSEGNYACDHNRVDFLYGQDSPEAQDEESFTCNSNRIVVNAIVHDDGRTLYTEHT